jgi:hypothetical protein
MSCLRLPAALEAPTKQNGNRIHDKQKHQQDNDCTGCTLDESGIATLGPVVDLDRQCGDAGSKNPSGGAAGYSRTNATMPIKSKGAVSPNAWARPMMAPVRIPGSRERQHMMENGLHFRGPEFQAPRHGSMAEPI